MSLAQSPGPAGANASGLIATAQSLAFEPGLYCVEVIGEAGAITELGVALPGVRIEPLPPTPARPGRARLVNSAEGEWLFPSTRQAFVLVVGGRAGALLTIYLANDGMAVPEIRISNVPVGLSSVAEAAARRSYGTNTIALAMLAHVTGVGDLAANDGWLGQTGRPIEGFALTPAPPFAAEDIEYQAILGADWSTPWVAGGVFCGSRGLQLPMLGFRLRLAASRSDYECTYSGRFAGGLSSGPHDAGEACEIGDVPLEALQVEIRRRPSPPGLG